MFLAVFVPALIGALAGVMGSLIGRAILALGIGFVTYKGITVAINGMKASVMSAVGGIPGDALSLVGYLGLDRGLTIMFSAVAASLAMRAIGGSVKRMIFK
ncbi:MAG: DUF2523 domain-containing protein [Glaciimonas sp.]|nr:DUF2523 domain-containing protein [Glaciimonas sp.]